VNIDSAEQQVEGGGELMRRLQGPLTEAAIDHEQIRVTGGMNLAMDISRFQEVIERGYELALQTEDATTFTNLMKVIGMSISRTENLRQDLLGYFPPKVETRERKSPSQEEELESIRPMDLEATRKRYDQMMRRMELTLIRAEELAVMSDDPKEMIDLMDQSSRIMKRIMDLRALRANRTAEEFDRALNKVLLEVKEQKEMQEGKKWP